MALMTATGRPPRSSPRRSTTTCWRLCCSPDPVKTVRRASVPRRGCRSMTSSDLWDDESARRYDESSADMFVPEVLGPTVDLLADLAGDGRALELAIGTGRVAVPLAARSVPVAGIELSSPGRAGRVLPQRRARHLVTGGR